MLKASLFACPLALGLAAMALAQQAPASGNAATGGQAGTRNDTSASMSVQKELEQAGFTEVHVTPGSFLVHAKTKAGQPVVMVVEAPHESTAGRSGVDLATGKHDAP